MITHDNGDNRKQNCLFILLPTPLTSSPVLSTSYVQSLENVVVYFSSAVIAMCRESWMTVKGTIYRGMLVDDNSSLFSRHDCLAQYYESASSQF